jgi:hypothetical protein
MVNAVGARQIPLGHQNLVLYIDDIDHPVMVLVAGRKNGQGERVR